MVDMLGLQSLQELIISTMVVTICHNFHKVCCGVDVEFQRQSNTITFEYVALQGLY